MKRDINNKIIAGVCSGMSKHLNLNPILIRLGFVAAFLAFGTGPIIYLIAWVIMPADSINNDE